MELIKGVSYEEIKKPDIKSRLKEKESTVVKPVKEESKSSEKMITGMNFDLFNNNDISIPLTVEEVPSKSTPRRNNSKVISSTGLVPVEKDTKYSATEPYMDKYQETNILLKTAIAQLDMGLQDMQQDLSMLRNNKTLRNKYQQMSMVQKNVGEFLGNKIQAIKELNSVITKCNDLELKRAKDLKELENQDDDKKIMDLYNAMISMPVGGQTGMISGFSSPMGPSTFDMTYAGNPNNFAPNIVTSIEGQADDSGYQNYLRNKTSAQNMMSLDANPNIQQVVVHNRATGQSYFEIMDMSTMRPVPNTDKYDNSFLEDTHMDFVNNVATNVNLGESYPIVQVGGDPILNEY